MVVVLPFANLSADPANDYLGVGLADFLTTSLARLPGVNVVSRAAAVAYRDRRVDTDRIARDLGADIVVDGAIHRSDDRIREDVNERLSDHSEIDATEIDVTVMSGEVTLRGTVDSRYEKRMAEDCAEEVRGVKDVHNELKVNRSFWQRLTGQGEEEETDRQAAERGARAGAIGGQGTTGTGTKRS